MILIIFDISPSLSIGPDCLLDWTVYLTRLYVIFFRIVKIFWVQNIHSWPWHDFLHLVVTLTVSNIEEIKLNITMMLRMKGLKDSEELQLQFKNVLVFWSHYQDSHNICKFSRTDWICILPKTSWFDPPPASAVKQPSKYCHNQLLETECQASGYGQDGGKNYSYKYEYIYMVVL